MNQEPVDFIIKQEISTEHVISELNKINSYLNNVDMLIKILKSENTFLITLAVVQQILFIIVVYFMVD